MLPKCAPEVRSQRPRALLLMRPRWPSGPCDILLRPWPAAKHAPQWAGSFEWKTSLEKEWMTNLAMPRSRSASSGQSPVGMEEALPLLVHWVLVAETSPVPWPQQRCCLEPLEPLGGSLEQGLMPSLPAKSLHGIGKSPASRTWDQQPIGVAQVASTPSKTELRLRSAASPTESAQASPGSPSTGRSPALPETLRPC